MRKSWLAGLVLMASTASAQMLNDETPPADIAAKVAAATAAAQAGGDGPYKADMISDPSLTTHTLYAPRNPAAAGKLPILVWGNGACTNIGNRFRYFLTEIASHGYLIIAIGPKGPEVAEWKVDINANNPLPPAERTAPSFAAQLTDAIDWAVAENTRSGSRWRGKLNTKAIAVAGQSCGGLQAISASADRRVTTTMVWNSGTFPDGTRPLSGTGDANKASLKRLHGPTAWFSGDESDVAFKNANADFEAVTGIPAFRAFAKGTGHSEVYRQPKGGVYSPVAVAWLDWQLKGSKPAAAQFLGKDCGLCTNPGWVVKWKGVERQSR